MAGRDRARRTSRTLHVIALITALVVTMTAPVGATTPGTGAAGAPVDEAGATGSEAAGLGAAGGEPTAATEHIDVLVALEPDAPAGLAQALAQLDGEITDDLDALDFVNARIPAGRLTALHAVPGVAQVSEHVAVTPLLDTTTGLVGAVARDDTEADASFAGLALTGAGSTIAVIDDGVLAGHEFFADGSGDSRVVAEGCFATKDCEVTTGPGAAAPRGDHGTHVAGIAAGAAQGGAGPIRGVAPESELIAVQVFDAAGGSNSAAITSAMNWIVERLEQGDPAFAQLSVVNLSVGTTPSSDCPVDGLWGGFEQAAQQLAALGVLTIAAAGNNLSRTAMSAPACLPSVVGIGATDVDPADAIASFSNLSVSTALVAPVSGSAPPAPATRPTTGRHPAPRWRPRTSPGRLPYWRRRRRTAPPPND